MEGEESIPPVEEVEGEEIPSRDTVRWVTLEDVSGKELDYEEELEDWKGEEDPGSQDTGFLLFGMKDNLSFFRVELHYLALLVLPLFFYIFFFSPRYPDNSEMLLVWTLVFMGLVYLSLFRLLRTKLLFSTGLWLYVIILLLFLFFGDQEGALHFQYKLWNRWVEPLLYSVLIPLFWVIVLLELLVLRPSASLEDPKSKLDPRVLFPLLLLLFRSLPLQKRYRVLLLLTLPLFIPLYNFPLFFKFLFLFPVAGFILVDRNIKKEVEEVGQRRAYPFAILCFAYALEETSELLELLPLSFPILHGIVVLSLIYCIYCDFSLPFHSCREKNSSCFQHGKKEEKLTGLWFHLQGTGFLTLLSLPGLVPGISIVYLIYRWELFQLEELHLLSHLEYFSGVHLVFAFAVLPLAILTSTLLLFRYRTVRRHFIRTRTGNLALLVLATTVFLLGHYIYQLHDFLSSYYFNQNWDWFGKSMDYNQGFQISVLYAFIPGVQISLNLYTLLVFSGSKLREEGEEDAELEGEDGKNEETEPWYPPDLKGILLLVSLPALAGLASCLPFWFVDSDFFNAYSSRKLLALAILWQSLTYLASLLYLALVTRKLLLTGLRNLETQEEEAGVNRG